MSFFETLFNKDADKNKSKLNWISLNEISQLDEIIEKSDKKPIAIFKHSTRCGVSRMVLNQFEKEYNLEDKMELYFLDLLQHRDISNAIAERFNVVHQSPQILLIRNEESVYDASHNDIQVEVLGKYL